MELKTVILTLKKNLALLVIITVCCAIIFTAAGAGFALFGGAGSVEAPVEIPKEAYLFSSSGNMTFKIEYPDEADSAARRQMEATVYGAIADRLESSAFLSEIIKEYGPGVSVSSLKTDLSCDVRNYPNRIIVKAWGMTAQNAARLANTAIKVALKDLPRVIDGISDISCLDEAINEYSDEEVKLLLSKQSDIINQAKDPSRLISQRIFVFLVFGYAMGFLIAAGVIFLKEYLSPYFPDAAAASSVLNIKILTEFGPRSLKKAAAQLALALKPEIPCLVSIVSMGEKIEVGAVIEALASGGAGLDVLVISEKVMRGGGGLQSVVAPAGELLRVAQEFSASGKYALIIIDGGSLDSDYQAWELLNLKGPAIGVVDQRKTKMASAEKSASQLDNLGLKLFGLIWMDDAKNKPQG